MTNVSSRLTIILKVLLPVCWLVFMGGLVLALFFQEGIYASSMAKWIMAIILFTGFTIFYFFYFPLKRIEMDETHFYVTNYRKTAKYTFDSIERIKEYDLLIIKFIYIRLHSSGIFGNKVSFIASRRLNTFLEKHPNISQQLAELPE